MMPLFTTAPRSLCLLRLSAIGDCCAFPHGTGNIRLESVQNAVTQSNYLALVLTGSETGPDT